MTRPWSQIRRELDPNGLARVLEARDRLTELEQFRDPAIDVLSVAMQAAQEYLFDDVTRKPIERRPQANRLLEAVEDLDPETRLVLARYLTGISAL